MLSAFSQCEASTALVFAENQAAQLGDGSFLEVVMPAQRGVA